MGIFSFLKRKMTVENEDERNTYETKLQDKSLEEDYSYNFEVKSVNNDVFFKEIEGSNDEELIEKVIEVVALQNNINIKTAASIEDVVRSIGKYNIQTIIALFKENKIIDSSKLLKESFNNEDAYYNAVENAVLTILFYFYEDGIDELLKVAAIGNDSSLKAINLLCKHAAKKVDEDKIVDSIIYIMNEFDDERVFNTLSYLSQVKGNFKVKKLLEAYYKKYIIEGDAESGYDATINLINFSGNYSVQQITFLKALALSDGQIDLSMLINGGSGEVSFNNITEDLRVKAAISFYSLYKNDEEINEKLMYLKENSLDSQLRGYLLDLMK